MVYDGAAMQVSEATRDSPSLLGPIDRSDRSTGGSRVSILRGNGFQERDEAGLLAASDGCGDEIRNLLGQIASGREVLFNSPPHKEAAFARRKVSR